MADPATLTATAAVRAIRAGTLAPAEADGGLSQPHGRTRACGAGHGILRSGPGQEHGAATGTSARAANRREGRARYR